MVNIDIVEDEIVDKVSNLSEDGRFKRSKLLDVIDVDSIGGESVLNDAYANLIQDGKIEQEFVDGRMYITGTVNMND